MCFVRCYRYEVPYQLDYKILQKMLLEQAEVLCRQFQNCQFHHGIQNVIIKAFCAWNLATN